jgi:hypothetical protein
MQAEQTDIALANTLDTLRSTGAAAGGATALAQAALKSKQGISADIEKQEMANQKLMAQGEQQMQQLQGAGKSAQMNMQENRDLRDITRLQDNMNLAQQQRAAGQATAGMAMASGIAGMAGLIDPEAKNVDDAAATTSAETSDFSNNGGFTEAQKLSMQGRSLDEKLSSYDPTAGMDIFNENIYDPTAYSMTQDFFRPKDFSQSKNSWYRTGLNNMVAERERLVQAGESTEAIQSLIDDTRKKYKI